jgi:hypothetical protein
LLFIIQAFASAAGRVQDVLRVILIELREREPRTGAKVPRIQLLGRSADTVFQVHENNDPFVRPVCRRESSSASSTRMRSGRSHLNAPMKLSAFHPQSGPSA